jgi:DNA primase
MIGRDTIDRIRSRVDIVAVIGESVKLTHRGRSWVGLCPFHQEKSPSFSVSPDRQLFYCFGCKAAGDVFKFVELQEGLSFIEVVKRLADRAGVEIVDERDPQDRAADQRARKAKEDLYGINALASEFFVKMLRDHPLARFARDELERRGLAWDGPAHDVLVSFGVGYAPHGWDGLATHLRQQGVSPALAEQVGLLAPRSGGGGFYDAFRHRLVVAVKDVQGRVVAFSGRTLAPPPGVNEDQKPPKYVNSRESAIYAKGHTLFGLYQARNALRAKGEAVVVEGNFDLVAMHARGIENVVAPLGTAFTADQGRLLRRFAPGVVLLFDNDGAGRKATWAARDTCKEVGLVARAARLRNEEGLKDPDEFLRAKGPEAMLALLKAARSLDEVLVDDVCEPVGEGANLAAKQAALGKIRPIVEGQEVAFREVLARRAAVQLGLDVGAVWRALRGGAYEQQESDRAERASGAAMGNGTVRATGNATGKPAGKAAPPSEEDLLSRAIFEALLAEPQLLEDPEIQEGLALVTGDWAFAILAVREEMRNSRREEGGFDASSLLARLPPSIQEFAAAKLAEPSVEGAFLHDGPSRRLLAKEGSLPDADAAVANRQRVLANARKLEKLAIDARYREIDREVARAEAEGDLQRAIALGVEKTRLSRMKNKPGGITEGSN